MHNGVWDSCIFKWPLLFVTVAMIFLTSNMKLFNPLKYKRLGKKLHNTIGKTWDKPAVQNLFWISFLLVCIFCHWPVVVRILFLLNCLVCWWSCSNGVFASPWLCAEAASHIKLLVVLGKRKIKLKKKKRAFDSWQKSFCKCNWVWFLERKSKKFEHESFSLLCLLVAEIDQQILI